LTCRLCDALKEAGNIARSKHAMPALAAETFEAPRQPAVRNMPRQRLAVHGQELGQAGHGDNRVFCEKRLQRVGKGAHANFP
jgi:hypothetical protein